MGEPASRSPGLAGLVDLVLQLRRDEELPSVELRRRDRAVGRELGDLQSKPEQQILAWLERVRPHDQVPVGPRAARVHAVASLLLILVGLLVGWGTAAAVFHYDGSQPVNVIRVLAIFVGAQALLLLLLGLTLLPPGATRFLPGASSMQEALALLSPGNLIRLGGRYFPPEYRDWLADSAGRGQAHRRLFGRVQRWGMVAASQGFAVAFNAGALAACLYLVTFSDLAFSWNTTLQVEPGHMHAATDALAAPWAGLAARAVPSLDLIEATRYFRLKDGVLPDWEHPEVLGEWWPFLVACIACYGLLPRVLLAGVARWRFAAATRRALLQLPAIPVVLSRLNNQLVETTSPDPDAEPEGAPVSASDEAVAVALRGAQPVWVSWADAPAPGDAKPAGGSHSLAQDQALIEEIAATPAELPVCIRVKSWEPPVTEFIDFLSDLRARLAPARPIAVRPAGLPGGSAPEARHVAAWQRRVRRLGDPYTAVLTEPPS